MAEAEIRTALVTGAARRVGRGLAEALAADGWRVVVHYNASAEPAAEVVEAISARGGRAVALHGDLSDGAETEALIGRAAAAAGPLTCLVNNASLFEPDRIETLSRADLDRHYAVNLRAPTLLSRDFAAQLPAGQDGLILNMLDQGLHDGGPAFLAYGICKVGLEQLTRKLAVRLAPRIRVNGIAPGYLLPGGTQTEARFQAAAAANPLSHGGSVAECAAALRFFLGAPSVTGEVIRLDGGLHLRQGGGDG